MEVSAEKIAEIKTKATVLHYWGQIDDDSNLVCALLYGRALYDEIHCTKNLYLKSRMESYGWQHVYYKKITSSVKYPVQQKDGYILCYTDDTTLIDSDENKANEALVNGETEDTEE